MYVCSYRRYQPYIIPYPLTLAPPQPIPLHAIKGQDTSSSSIGLTGKLVNIYSNIVREKSIWCVQLLKLCHESNFHNFPSKNEVFTTTFDVPLSNLLGTRQ